MSTPSAAARLVPSSVLENTKLLPEGPAGPVLHNLVEDLFTLLQLQALPPGAPFGLKHLVPMEEDIITDPREEKWTKQKMYIHLL